MIGGLLWWAIAACAVDWHTQWTDAPKVHMSNAWRRRCCSWSDFRSIARSLHVQVNYRSTGYNLIITELLVTLYSFVVPSNKSVNTRTPTEGQCNTTFRIPECSMPIQIQSPLTALLASSSAAHSFLAGNQHVRNTLRALRTPTWELPLPAVHLACPPLIFICRPLNNLDNISGRKAQVALCLSFIVVKGRDRFHGRRPA